MQKATTSPHLWLSPPKHKDRLELCTDRVGCYTSMTDLADLWAPRGTLGQGEMCLG